MFGSYPQGPWAGISQLGSDIQSLGESTEVVHQAQFLAPRGGEYLAGGQFPYCRLPQGPSLGDHGNGIVVYLGQQSLNLPLFFRRWTALEPGHVLDPAFFEHGKLHAHFAQQLFQDEA